MKRLSYKEFMLASIFDERGVKRALGRYTGVMRDELPANFLICRKIAVEKPKNMSEALRQHENAIKKFNELKSKTRNLNEFKEIENPDYSLLDLKSYIADKLVEGCLFCERKCNKNRKAGDLGVCGVGYEARVATAFEHIGEEPEFVPSGTIFFSGCNMSCQFCQNWDISQSPKSGEVWSPQRIANWIEAHRNFGIKNVNFVGGEPTPNLHNIIAALNICKKNIPVIWNSNMYMSSESMSLLYGIVDAYIDDFKYGNDACALKLSKVPNYWSTIARNNLLAKEHAEIMVRHLVMPNHVECCSKPILEWLAKNLGDSVRINIMSQYHPDYKALEIDEISRRVSREEYAGVVNFAKEIGLWNIEIQGI